MMNVSIRIALSIILCWAEVATSGRSSWRHDAWNPVITRFPFLVAASVYVVVPRASSGTYSTDRALVQVRTQGGRV